MSSPATILVTGGAGFIGSHLVDRLLARGDQVAVIDNFDTFYDPAMKRRNIAGALAQPRCTLVAGDIRDGNALGRVARMGPFDGIVHLAARAGVRPSIADPALYDDVNVRGTTLMLEFARRHLHGHFVLGSSSSVYGATSTVPFRESEPADRPSSPYAATKRSNELACYAYHHLYGLDITCLRFFTVYGPRQRPEMAIHKFTRLIDSGQQIDVYGDGHSKRDYTFVADIVDGVIRALDRPSGYRILNLGTTATTSLLDLASTLAELLELPLLTRQLPDQPGDVPITFADITRARAEVGYEPTTPIASGLVTFIAWYREQKVLAGASASLSARRAAP
jgi:UDP-glucuronate 4-epimerase